MTSVNAPSILALFALFIAYTLFRAASDVPRLMSPQGCRMSWMSPSYLLQAEFNTSWTPLASRYSLWLYREVGWEHTQATGLPVLFIPGNAGSPHQVRSIASSAARQYYSSPFVVSPDFARRGAKPVDFYAVEFNEDLSAFHGPTLESQIAYTSAAVDYLLSRYPPGTQITVMGHSMGGIVGTALLSSANITALITMAAPHTLPPARFDSQIEGIYNRNRETLRRDETPILSICGGATDMMIPSESCILPKGEKEAGVYRRTVFTSALEGTWSGVGHREIVWCHQVRWRVARAALELAVTRAVEERTQVLDRWLRDASVLPLGNEPTQHLKLDEGEYEAIPHDSQLVVHRPLGKWTYLVPIPSAGDRVDSRTFVLYVSQGEVSGLSPEHALDLRVSVTHCTERSADATVLCDSLVPTSLKLLPAPIPGTPFPVPDEGTDESEGIVFFEAKLPHEAQGWVGVTVDGGGDRRGWFTGGFEQPRQIKSDLGLWNLLFGDAKISVPSSDSIAWRTCINLPRLPATALLVYRLVPKAAEHSSCTAPLFPPLLVHTSQASELHYYRLDSDRPVFLHTHSSAPYVPPLLPAPSQGLNLMVHSSRPTCRDMTEVHLSVDWWASAGRISTRYPTTLLSWGVGVVSFLLFHFYSPGGEQASVGESLGVFVSHWMPALMAVAGVTGLLPWGPDYYLGTGNELGMLRAVLAALLVGVATGLVCVSWWLLQALMWPLRLLAGRSIQRRPEEGSMRRSVVVSMALVLALIFLLVPWQVAFLGCWVIQLLNCTATVANTPVSLASAGERGDGMSDDLRSRCRTAYDQNAHILLLMTWLLPLVAPILVVWVRTMQTAGYTTPFNGDHNVFKVVPVLALVDLLGRASGRPIGTRAAWWFPVRWGWIGVAVVAFVVGGRRAYVVYDVASIQLATVVLKLLYWYK